MIRDDFRRLLQAAQTFSRDNDSDAVLFLGHPSDPIPRALIVDKDLSLAARIVWCFFRQQSDSPDAAGTAPNYDTIQRELSIGGRGTVAAAVHELRVTRWITLMPQPAHHRRHIYLLHNTPLSFNDAVELDPDYPNRIAEAIKSPSRSVRNLAQRVLDGAMVAAHSNDMNNELFRLAGYGAQDPVTDGSSDDSMLSFFMFQRSGSDSEPSGDPMPSEDPGPVELNLHSDIFLLSPAMENLARIKLNFVPAKYRQPMLDELAVRILERKTGDNPVKHPLGYLSWMVNQYRETGELPLTGRGDRLPEIIGQLTRASRAQDEKPIRDEIARLTADVQHFHRTISRLESHGHAPDEALIESLDSTEQRLNELKSLIPEGANGPHGPH